jgi:hypothetical protein
MSDQKKKGPRYICYLSFGKVNNIFAQISDYVQSGVKERKTIDVDGTTNVSTPSIFGLLKAGLSFGARHGRELIVEGEIDPIQKLQKIIAHYESSRKIDDLNKCIDQGNVNPGVTCFSYDGLFSCLSYKKMDGFAEGNQNYIETEEKETSYSPLHGISGLRTTSGMCILETKYRDYTIFLACSMKYFSDMGGSRVCVGEGSSKNDLVDIHPHSGNHFFFAGKYQAHFQAILFLTGQNGNELYGSPLALINEFSPDFGI